MTPIDIGVSASDANALSTGSGARNINNQTYESSPVMWIVLGVVALFGLVLYLKLR